jgi:histone H3/H4
MSTSGTKRSGSKKPSTKSRSSRGTSKAKSRSSGGKSGGKKRRSAPSGSSSGKSSRGKSRKGSSSSSSKRQRTSKSDTKGTKVAANEATEAGDKKEKISARKIVVPWNARPINPKSGKPNWAIRTQPFGRIVRHYAHQLLPDMRMAQHVAKAIQSAIEEEMVNVLRQAAMMAIHANRRTVNSDDVDLQSRLSRPFDPSDEEYMALLAKPKRSSRSKSTSAEGGDAANKAPRASAKPRPRRVKAEAGAAAAAAAADPADGSSKKKKSSKKKGGAVAAAATDAAPVDATMATQILPPQVTA